VLPKAHDQGRPDRWPLGCCVPASELNTAVDYASVAELGTNHGLPAHGVMDHSTTMVAPSAFFIGVLPGWKFLRQVGALPRRPPSSSMGLLQKHLAASHCPRTLAPVSRPLPHGQRHAASAPRPERSPSRS